jgi:DNA-binding CsgD family transcriptional regulator
MEGGEILDNTASLFGGGVAVGSRASFKKTGGVIYGEDSGEGLRNTVIDGTGAPLIYGHAVCVSLPQKPLFQFRDDTVGKDDHVSYSGSPTGDGVFGEGEHWQLPGEDGRRFLLIGGIVVLVIGGFAVFCAVKARRKKQAAMTAGGMSSAVLDEIKRSLTPREKEVFDLLLTDRTLKVIAGELDISYSGVKFHTKKIYRKFDIQSRTELIVLFTNNRLPAPEG